MVFSVLGRCVTAVTLVTLFFSLFLFSCFKSYPTPTPIKTHITPSK